jgi:hypothetical protein
VMRSWCLMSRPSFPWAIPFVLHHALVPKEAVSIIEVHLVVGCGHLLGSDQM